MQIKILPNSLAYLAILLGTLFSCAEQPQNIQFTMPDDATEYEQPTIEEPTETPTIETPTIETPQTGETDMPKTEPILTMEATEEATEQVTENRIINAVIQNELKAKERLTIAFPVSELDAPESWTTCKIIDSETEKTLALLKSASKPMPISVTFQADNERHIHKSFVATIEYYDTDSKLLRSEAVTIYAPITQFWLGWQNREGKIDQGFVLLKAGEVKYLSTINDRTGASDCAMRLALRIPEGHTAIITKSTASIASGSKPMSTHWRFADYNAKYRAAMYPAPDDPLYHYDTDKSKWNTDESLTLDVGLHIVHIVPNDSNFDDTEIIATVEYEGNSYSISNYYIPENIELLKSLSISE